MVYPLIYPSMMLVSPRKSCSRQRQRDLTIVSRRIPLTQDGPLEEGLPCKLRKPNNNRACRSGRIRWMWLIFYCTVYLEVTFIQGFQHRNAAWFRQEDPERTRSFLPIMRSQSAVSLSAIRSTSLQKRAAAFEKRAAAEEEKEYNLWEEPLSIQSFNMDLHNLAFLEHPQKAQDALEIMEHIYEDICLRNNMENQTSSTIRPNAASYATVIEGWCYANAPDTTKERIARKVQALLDRMEQSAHLQPNELCYVMACQAWADAVGDETASGHNAMKAQAILDRLLEQQQDKEKDENGNDAEAQLGKNGNEKRGRRQRIPISTKLFSIVVEAWCRRVGKVNFAMDRVESLLQTMEQEAADKAPNAAVFLPRPNVLTYTSVIGGLARSRKRDLASQGMKVLDRMRAYGVEPDMVAYTSVLNCWTKTTGREERRQSHIRALEILQQMEELYTSDEGTKYDVKPNAITYATAIKAIGNSFATNGPELAEEIIHRMYRLTNEGSIHVPPTVETYNALIMSLSSAKSPTWSRAKRAQRAEYWLNEMVKRSEAGDVTVKPNVRTWGAVIKAWCDSGRPDAGEQAQRILDQMQEMYRSKKSLVKPNAICYTTVINAWVRGTSVPAKVALNRVESLLRHMEDEFAATRDPSLRPSKITYISVIDAYGRKCKKAKAAWKAQVLVDRMVKLYARDEGYDRPTRIVFNALINAYSKSDDPNAAPQAEKIFRWMESQYRAGDDFVRPDEITLCAVLNVWANHAANGGAQRAQDIMDHTESLSVEDRGFTCSIVCYNILIKAWGRSRSPDSVQRAEAILNHLEERCRQDQGDEVKTKLPCIRPDITTYSSVINCCAYYAGDESGRKEALETALRVFRKIEQDSLCDGGPNMITFGTIFKAIAKLMRFGAERESMVESLFQKCQALGQVDSFVLSQVRGASSVDLYRRLVLDPAKIDAKDENNIEKILKSIPLDWGRNVVSLDR